jgi:hypothetical protein
VVKYFGKASVASPSVNKASTVSPYEIGKASVVTPYQEVKQEERLRIKPAQPRRVSSPVDEQEQRRRIEGRDRRLEKEADSRKEINVGYNWISEEIERLARQKVMVR